GAAPSTGTAPRPGPRSPRTSWTPPGPATSRSTSVSPAAAGSRDAAAASTESRAARPRAPRARSEGRVVPALHDLAAERDQRDGDQLEVGDPERDADDREAQQDAGDQVPEGEPPSRDDDPD